MNLIRDRVHDRIAPITGLRMTYLAKKKQLFLIHPARKIYTPRRSRSSKNSFAASYGKAVDLSVLFRYMVFSATVDFPGPSPGARSRR